jgi:hypothetical protein
MSQEKTEARVETGFVILYEEEEWLVGYYRHQDRALSELHVFSKSAWGALESQPRTAKIPSTVMEKFSFWKHMLDQ